MPWATSCAEEKVVNIFRSSFESFDHATGERFTFSVGPTLQLHPTVNGLNPGFVHSVWLKRKHWEMMHGMHRAQSQQQIGSTNRDCFESIVPRSPHSVTQNALEHMKRTPIAKLRFDAKDRFICEAEATDNRARYSIVLMKFPNNVPSTRTYLVDIMHQGIIKYNVKSSFRRCFYSRVDNCTGGRCCVVCRWHICLFLQ